MLEDFGKIRRSESNTAAICRRDERRDELAIELISITSEDADPSIKERAMTAGELNELSSFHGLD